MPVSVLINKNNIINIGGFHQDDGYPAVDFSTWIRLFELSGKVAWLDECLGFWRQSEKQVTRIQGVKISEITLKIALDQFDQLPVGILEQLKINKREIIKVRYKIAILPSYLACTRRALINKDKDEANLYIRKLIRYGSMKRKIQGVCAIIAAILGTDIEFIFSWYERIILNQKRSS